MCADKRQVYDKAKHFRFFFQHEIFIFIPTQFCVHLFELKMQDSVDGF